MKNAVCFLLVAIQLYFNASAQIITTYAGDGLSGYSGDGGPATIAKMQTPSAVAVDRIGNVYFADQNGNRIRKIDLTGIISTVAGIGGVGGYIGDGSLATLAKLNFPTGVAVDGAGNIYIADQFNNVIRKIDTVGIISTIAGNGTIGYSGDSGLATNAQLWHPADLCVDINGNIFTVDQDNSVVRKITPSGNIYTIAGNGISGFSGDGGAATAAKLNFPEGIATDSTGNIYIADLYNNRVRKVNTSGIISTVAGNGTGGFSGDSTLATNAMIYYPSAVAIDSIGNLYIADADNNRIRKVNTTGIITSVAGTGISGTIGDGWLATEAEINYPQGVAVDKHGSIFIADYYNSRIRKVTYGIISLSCNVFDDFSFCMSPNPAKGLLTIQVKNMNTDQKVNIINQSGETVYTSVFNSKDHIIDVDHFRAGIYLVTVTSGGSIIKQKLVIN